MVNNLTGFSKNRRHIIIVLIGLGLISIHFLSSPDLGSGLEIINIKPFQRELLSYSLLLIFFYLNFYLIVPKFYFTKRWFWLIIILIISYVFILKIPGLFFQGAEPFSKSIDEPFMPGPPRDNTYMKVIKAIFSRENYFFQFVIIFMISLFLQLEERLNKIRNEKLNTEVSYLKAQINPHFLFNTLNSLYALALTKSDKAPDAILKLSHLMRYVVTESEQKLVPLQKEIDYIQNFVDLQHLRLTENTKIDLDFSGDFSNCKIAPLLLISFVENAFKYGINGEDDSSIMISIQVNEKKTLTFDTVNTIVETTPKNDTTHKGLKNTQKRLEILYPEKHKLSLTSENNTYIVHLILQLE